MRNVTIHRCPTCPNIGGYTNQLVTALRNDPNVKVNVVDGHKGEFSVDVDGLPINTMDGESLRPAWELETEIRGAQIAAAG